MEKYESKKWEIEGLRGNISELKSDWQKIFSKIYFFAICIHILNCPHKEACLDLLKYKSYFESN